MIGFDCRTKEELNVNCRKKIGVMEKYTKLYVLTYLSIEKFNLTNSGIVVVVCGKRVLLFSTYCSN